MPRGVFERPSAEERFWKFVNKETGSDCWFWTGYKSNTFYGSMKINKQNIRAHRFSYELHYGKIPEGLVVMHSCDQPSCVNPYHLSVGTHADNTRDKINKNRQPRGSSIFNSLITEEEVIQIKNDLNKGMKQIEISKKYQIAYHIICDIKTGRSWKHVNI